MGKSRTNFKNTQNKDAAKYILWMLLKPEFVLKRQTLVFYSYNRKKNSGMDQLIKLVFENYKNQWKIARIYDNSLPKGSDPVKEYKEDE